MKKYSFFLLFLFVAFGCERDSNRRSNNPYLPNYSFSATLNLNLPAYSQLKLDGNALKLTVDGDIDVVIIKVGGSDYRAWNGNCPNQPPTACSKLSIQSGSAKCGCEDGYIYNMYDGRAQNAQYIMVPYRVEVLDINTIRVYN